MNKYHLMIVVQEHVNREENNMFSRLESNLSDEQQKRLAIDFHAAKSRIQDQRLASLRID